MGDIVIRLRGSARTGHREVLVDYESDPDLTHQEHERRHREILERLVIQGTITREEAEEAVFVEHPRPLTERERLSEGQP